MLLKDLDQTKNIPKYKTYPFYLIHVGSAFRVIVNGNIYIKVSPHAAFNLNSNELTGFDNPSITGKNHNETTCYLVKSTIEYENLITYE